MKRRTILWAGLGGVGALFIGWGTLPVRQRLRGSHPLPVNQGQIALNGWVKISEDESVTVMVPRCELGQGIHTGLAMLVAEELDCDWQHIKVENAPIDALYNNLAVVADGLPFHPDNQGMLRNTSEHLTKKIVRHIGVMATGGSSSIKDLWEPLRQSGAYARATLLEASARHWQVPASQCTLAAGRIKHPQRESLSFGELIAQWADRAAEFNALTEKLMPKDYVLKDPSSYRLIGRPLKRLDSPNKVNGTAQYAADIHQPGMWYAAIVFAPQRDAALSSAPKFKVKIPEGVKKVISIPSLNGAAPAVVVVADQRWRALQALSSLSLTWSVGQSAELDSPTLTASLRAALADTDSAWTYYDTGKADLFNVGLSTENKKIESDYSVPYLAHAAMEPLCCSIRYDGDRATVWAGVQIPDTARKIAALNMGLEPEQVNFQQLYIGGSFGRRLENDFIAQAAFVARQCPGVLVQLLWQRIDDLRQDFYRPACEAHLKAVIDAPRKRILAWHATSAGQSIQAQAWPRVLGLPMTVPDRTTVDGSFDLPYDIPNVHISHNALSLPVRVGFWRSVGYSHQTFITETFMDQLATSVLADPFAFREAHLGTHPRQLAVLRLAANKASWNSPPGHAEDGAPIARGIALATSFGSTVAEVAEVSLSPEGRLRVHKVTVAIDCGLAVNPALIEQQMESSVIYGLSAALYGQISFANGTVEQSNFHDYPVLRMSESPQIQTYIVPSLEHPSGVGEPGLPPLAPAVANALAVLTGQRSRRLPLSGVSSIVRDLSLGA